MAVVKDKSKQKKRRGKSGDADQDSEQATGYGKSGGNMGAGQSGREDLGSEKPSDGPDSESNKPA
jgi:hypothetical protein